MELPSSQSLVLRSEVGGSLELLFFFCRIQCVHISFNTNDIVETCQLLFSALIFIGSCCRYSSLSSCPYLKFETSHNFEPPMESSIKFEEKRQRGSERGQKASEWSLLGKLRKKLSLLLVKDRKNMKEGLHFKV